jgi:hypothetical protein
VRASTGTKTFETKVRTKPMLRVVAKRRRSKGVPRVEFAPKLSELIEGARDLADDLLQIVELAEHAQKLYEKTTGAHIDLGQALRRGQFVNWEPDRVLKATVGPYLQGEHRRLAKRRLGGDLARIASEVVKGDLKPIAALDQARAKRRDGGPNVSVDEISGELRGRSDLEKARRVYDLLARGADVDPVPDTRRGRRGRLGQLLEFWLSTSATTRESP